MADALRTQFIKKLIQKVKFTLAYDALNYPRRPFYTRRVACNRATETSSRDGLR
jgi:hypothetical protein